MTASMGRDKPEMLKILPVGRRRPISILEHPGHFRSRIKDIFEFFAKGIFPDEGGGCLTEHAGPVAMFEIGNHAILHGNLNRDTIPAGGVIEGFLGIGMLNLPIPYGVGRKAQQLFLIEIVHSWPL